MTDTIITTSGGSVIFAGTNAVQVYRLTAIASMLRMEAKGIRFRLSALKSAKGDGFRALVTQEQIHEEIGNG